MNAALTQFEVSPDNPQFQSLDGVLFDKPLTTLHYYPPDKSNLVFQVPEGVTSIGNKSFEECSHLTSVKLPTSLASISRGAFYNSVNLTQFEVSPDNSQYQSLNGVLFDKALTTLSYYPPGKPDPAYHIPESVKNIANLSFAGHQHLTTVIIPPNISNIGFGAFSGCSSLINIVIPEGISSIQRYAFNRCSSLTNVTIPGSVTNFGEGLFNECTSLSRVAISKGVTFLPSRIFSGCTSLSTIVLPDGLVSVRWFAFGQCTSLTNIVIPDSVTSIQLSAFAGCTSLTNIAISGGINSIDDTAFVGCNNLTKILLGSPPNAETETAIQKITTLSEVHVWPEDTAFFGDEGAHWNGLAVQLRDTTPRINHLDVGNFTTAISTSGGPDRTYILKYSTDLKNLHTYRFHSPNNHH